MELDERARSRLRALASDAGGELDEAARGRIARRVADEGPRVLRRARRTRAASRLGGTVLVLGLCGWAALSWSAPQQAAVPVGANTAAPQDAVRTAAARPCARRVLAAEGRADDAGERRFALGELGDVVAAAGSAIALDVRDACRVIVRLDQGRADVHAADLGGGELSVQTPSGEVVVHGTVFAVTHGSGGALTVDVDDGLVSVTPRGRSTVRVEAGRRLRVPSEGAVALEQLPASERVRLRAALGLAQAEPNVAPAPEPEQANADPEQPASEPAAAAPNAAVAATPARAEPEVAPSAEALLAEADRAWRAGDLERARERYRRAGALGGVAAEAAWLSLARRELSVERPAAAHAALEAYRARFSHGKLAAEALGIEFRAALQQNDMRAARRIGEQLQRGHARTPQGQAAARWLREHTSEAGP